jgi:hypothetical protein
LQFAPLILLPFVAARQLTHPQKDQNCRFLKAPATGNLHVKTRRIPLSTLPQPLCTLDLDVMHPGLSFTHMSIEYPDFGQQDSPSTDKTISRSIGQLLL